MIESLFIIILLLLLNTLFIKGIYFVTNGGNFLEFIRNFLAKVFLNTKSRYKSLLENIYDGLIGCEPCMSSIWGCIFLLIANLFFEHDIYLFIFSYKVLSIPVYTLILSQLLVLVNYYIEILKNKSI